jgi:hypothetical protein
MSVNSIKQTIDQSQEWYKWFNKKYNRYDKIRFRKPKKIKD